MMQDHDLIAFRLLDTASRMTDLLRRELRAGTAQEAENIAANVGDDAGRAAVPDDPAGLDKVPPSRG